MNSRLALAFTALIPCLIATEATAGTITQWDFATVTAGPFNSPAPTVGAGTATVLGMDNTTYVYGTVAAITGTGTFTTTGKTTIGSMAFADVLSTTGSPSNKTENTWRIRGPSNNPGGPNGTGNGWNLAAPQYSQGAQFSTSTAGFSNISFHFDWFSTNQGVKNLQEQYTLDGSTWVNINGPLTAVPNDFAPTRTIDFSGIAGAANNASFGVRLVSAYDTTLPILNYGGASGGYYNNNSGNWRFGNVGFSGSPAAVPEPSSILLCSIGAGVILVHARRRLPKK